MHARPQTALEGSGESELSGSLRVRPEYGVAVDTALSGADPCRLLESPAGTVVLDAELQRLGGAHLDRVLAVAPDTFDGPVLAFATVSSWSVRTTLATYHQMLRTCDAVRAEAALAGGDVDTPRPLRARATAAAGTHGPQRSGAGRAAAIGVSVAVIVSTPGAKSVVLGRRARRLATDAGLWHIAPSGMLEPHHWGNGLADAVASELGEELGVFLPPEQLRTRLGVLGLAHDLSRLRPEVCLVLRLTSAEAAPVATQVAGGSVSPEFDELALVPLRRMRQAWAAHPPGTLTPAAAGVLTLLESWGAGGKVKGPVE
jgi:NUDIX domain